jgi:hypothetical protein
LTIDGTALLNGVTLLGGTTLEYHSIVAPTFATGAAAWGGLAFIPFNSSAKFELQWSADPGASEQFVAYYFVAYDP